MSEKTARIFPLVGGRTPSDSDRNSSNSSAPGIADAQFLRTWFEYDSETHRRRFNPGAILGLVIVGTLSAGFWTAIGLLASRLLR